jgi:hypothetical protein
MITLGVLFLIVALILFIIAAIGLAAGRYNLMAAGLAFWVASSLIGHIGR